MNEEQKILWLPDHELMEYAMELEVFHSVFYRLIDMSRLYFDESIPTAAVAFEIDSTKPIRLAFNEDFWNRLNKKERCWILSHEMWHIINGHGARMALAMNQGQKEVLNMAMDIVVHYDLEESLGMDREEWFPNWKDYCFLETIFPNDSSVKAGENVEYYYNRLVKECQSKDGGNSGDGDSDGDGTSNGSNSNKGKKRVKRLSETLISWDPAKYTEKEIKKLFEKLVENMSAEEIKNLKEINVSSQLPGNTSLGNWIQVSNHAKKKNPRWETVIKKWVHKRIRDDFAEQESWADLNKRMSQVLEINRNVMLPTDVEKFIATEKKDKIEVMMFLDASGSCYNMADRFFKAARSIPPDKFNVTLCSFDTSVFELDIKKAQLRGGGGTSFYIMEEYIKKKFTKKYPDAVFVLTDGYGDTLTTDYPKKWFWFLTEYNTEYCIPKESHIYKLTDFT